MSAAPEVRDDALEPWRRRMTDVLASARRLDELAKQLPAADLEDLVAEAERLADEERRQGALYGAVLETLGGEPIAAIEPVEEPVLHVDATPLEVVLRGTIGICCVGETVAAALLGAERFETPEIELRRLLTEVWRDEIGHSRFGWRLLARVSPTLDRPTKERLGSYLDGAFARLVEHQLACAPSRTAWSVGVDVVDRTVVPALEMYGLEAAKAWARHARSTTPSQHRDAASEAGRPVPRSPRHRVIPACSLVGTKVATELRQATPKGRS